MCPFYLDNNLDTQGDQGMGELKCVFWITDVHATQRFPPGSWTHHCSFMPCFAGGKSHPSPLHHDKSRLKDNIIQEPPNDS